MRSKADPLRACSPAVLGDLSSDRTGGFSYAVTVTLVVPTRVDSVASGLSETKLASLVVPTTGFRP